MSRGLDRGSPGAESGPNGSTGEDRLLNERGLPGFGLSFYILDRQGRHAGVSMYAGAASRYAVCTGNGAELPLLESLLDGSPQAHDPAPRG